MTTLFNSKSLLVAAVRQAIRIFASSLIAFTLVSPASADTDAPTVLITGSNASHGLAFAEEYAKLGWNVIATCRTPAKADRLKVLASEYPNIVIEELDIVDDDEIDALAEKYDGTPIDVLLNNAGIYEKKKKHRTTEGFGGVRR